MIKLYQACSSCFFAALLLIFILQGCVPPDPGIWKNDQIPSGKKDDLHQLTGDLFKAIKAGHPNEIEMNFSSDMLQGNYTSLTDKIAWHLKNEDYNLLDEYYVVHKYKGEQTIKGKTHDLNYQSIAREMYIALFLPKTGDDKWMITVTCAKFSYGWRIAALDVDQYSLAGKTGLQLYQQAVTDNDKGYLVNVVNTMELASRCFRPSPYWQYHNETAMTGFYAQAIGNANIKYKFPIIVTGVPTKPSIFRITNQNIPEGNFPSIYYLSKVKLTDTLALKKENLQIRNVIEHVLPGITKEKKYVLYSAFNEMPTAARFVKSYDVTQKLW